MGIFVTGAIVEDEKFGAREEKIASCGKRVVNGMGVVEIGSKLDMNDAEVIKEGNIVVLLNILLCFRCLSLFPDIHYKINMPFRQLFFFLTY